MTPEEARSLLDDFVEFPRRQRRYELEGGTRRAWKCLCGCGYHTEAHSEDEARENLVRHKRVDPRCIGPHTRLEAYAFRPPFDFR